MLSLYNFMHSGRLTSIYRFSALSQRRHVSDVPCPIKFDATSTALFFYHFVMIIPSLLTTVFAEPLPYFFMTESVGSGGLQNRFSLTVPTANIDFIARY